MPVCAYVNKRVCLCVRLCMSERACVCVHTRVRDLEDMGCFSSE